MTDLLRVVAEVVLIWLVASVFPGSFLALRARFFPPRTRPSNPYRPEVRTRAMGGRDEDVLGFVHQRVSDVTSTPSSVLLVAWSLSALLAVDNGDPTTLVALVVNSFVLAIAATIVAMIPGLPRTRLSEAPQRRVVRLYAWGLQGLAALALGLTLYLFHSTLYQ